MERKIEYLKDKPLSPLLKWPGGKSSDLKQLKTNYPEYFPKKIERYYEPFLGGGAVWLATNAKELFVNDICVDLIDFYEYIRDQDTAFYGVFAKFEAAWDLLRDIAENNAEALYDDSNALSKYEVELGALSLTGNCFPTISKITTSKIKRIKVVERKVGKKLTPEDCLANVESALKAGYYTYVRDVFNKSTTKSPLRTAAFYFLRDYCFSSMFRYNSKGAFNVPYGGLSYNKRSPAAKMQYWQSSELQDHLTKTVFGRTDFADFLDEHKPMKEDFIFVDPPYDTEFSTYDKKEFGHTEQERLADYLINKTDAQFMAVMKHTPYILSLYEGKKDIVCHSFDKEYQVSFRDRNDRKVTHLIACRVNQ